MTKKWIRQSFMPLPAALLTLLAVLLNSHVMEMELPASGLTLFVTLFYLLGWCFLAGICIKKYYRVVLFCYAVFWFLSFLACSVSAMIRLINAQALSFMGVTDLVFVAPVYGLHTLFDTVTTIAAGAGFSVGMAILCFLCVRRRSDSLPKPKRRRKKKPAQPPMPPQPPAAAR